MPPSSMSSLMLEKAFVGFPAVEGREAPDAEEKIVRGRELAAMPFSSDRREAPDAEERIARVFSTQVRMVQSEVRWNRC